MAKARKRFGQHFLEPAWVAKLIAAIDPQPTDHFIEIGPGRGAITAPLAARVERLVVVEVDRDLAAALEARQLPNMTVVTEDVLAVDLVALAGAPAKAGARSVDAQAGARGANAPGEAAARGDDAQAGARGADAQAKAGAGRDDAATRNQRGRALARPTDASEPPSRIAGNLPYNISSPILFKLLEASTSGLFKDAHLMLQKEVADRLVARPGTGDYGVLTLSTMIRADVTRVLSLPPGAFRPAPKVHSAVVRLTFRPPPPDVDRPELLIEIVRSVFTQRRKTISNALAPFATARGADARDLLAQAAVDPQARPETLTLSDYARLSRACAIVSP